MPGVSVTVKVPALDGSYDFIIPERMSVDNVCELMVKILNSEYGITVNQQDLMLFDKKDGMALRSECSFLQLGIKDGSVLLLM